MNSVIRESSDQLMIDNEAQESSVCVEKPRDAHASSDDTDSMF